MLCKSVSEVGQLLPAAGYTVIRVGSDVWSSCPLVQKPHVKNMNNMNVVHTYLL